MKLIERTVSTYEDYGPDWNEAAVRSHWRTLDALHKRPLCLVERDWRIQELARQIVQLRDRYQRERLGFDSATHLLIEAESLADERYFLMRAAPWQRDEVIE